MAYGTLKRIAGPLALTATLTTNVYQGGQSGSALIYDKVEQIHVVNKTGTVANFTLYLGATGANVAGTEFFFQQPVNGDNVYDWFGLLKMTSSDFLVGGASAGTTLTITIMGEQFVV